VNDLTAITVNISNPAVMEDKEKSDLTSVAYRGSKLPSVPEDLVFTGAMYLDCGKRLWVLQAQDVWFRPMMSSVSQGYFVDILRIRKDGILSWYRHTGTVHATILCGR
jgi:hypothetical protein